MPSSASSASGSLPPQPAPGTAAMGTDVNSFIVHANHCAKLKQPRVALSIYEESSAFLDAAEQGAVFAAVMRTLLKLRRVDLALALHELHVQEMLLRQTPVDAWSAIEQQAQVALFVQLLRHGTSADIVASPASAKQSGAYHGSIAEAERLLARLDDLSPPPPTDARTPSAGGAVGTNVMAEEAARAAAAAATVAEVATAAVASRTGEQLWKLICRQMLPPLALARLRRQEPNRALALIRRHASGVRWAAEKMPEHPAALAAPLETYTQLMRGFGKAKCPAGVYDCLDALEAAALTPDSEGMQVLVDALAQQERIG